MKTAVIRFPGSNCDQDCYLALQNLGAEVEYIWHKEDKIDGVDLIVVPGGFAYGDYLRCGAIARFSPVMQAVVRAAKEGRFVLGICNGFQILTEAGLLPGALIRNRQLRFICHDVHLRVENHETPLTHLCSPKQILKMPIAHGEGSYFAEDNVLDELESEGRVLFRYVNADGVVDEASNLNGSCRSIAGICNAGRNVFGLMPHPERASESRLGSNDGSILFQSLFTSIAAKNSGIA